MSSATEATGTPSGTPPSSRPCSAPACASELCSLAIADLFLESGSANVLVRRGKGGKTLLVPISAGLAAYLSGFLGWKVSIREPVAPASPVFMSERRSHMTRSAVHRLWKAALKGAGPPTRFGVDATRHSYAVEDLTRDVALPKKAQRVRLSRVPHDLA